MIKCLFIELGRAGRENIWPLGHGAQSVRHDNGPNIFPSGTPTQSISTYSHSAHANAYGPHTGIFSIALQWKRVRCRTGQMMNSFIIPSQNRISRITKRRPLKRNCQVLGFEPKHVFNRATVKRVCSYPTKFWIFNNYSPKWRWFVVDIYRTAKR